MCGICGYVDHATAGPPHVAAVRRMMQALVHRGPDAEGLWRAGPAVLGHRRLAIIDLRPEGDQPMLDERGDLALVANGEIYNFRELRAGLEQRGHGFRSGSDSEVILHLYEEEGTECLARLRGMFAFALWDAPRRRLIVARDRAGEKPLYYASRGGCFWFASELAALHGALPWRPSLDGEAIDRYLTLQYVPAPFSAFEGVRKLPAAHLVTVEPGREPRVERYWRLSFAPGRPVSRADAIAETRALCEEAVALRTVADVPLGAFLSGGVDSSTVVALLARGRSRPLQTFAVDFEGGDGADAHHARLVAARYATDHTELVVTPDMLSLLPALVRSYGEPFADPSAVPTWYVSQLARQHVTVALSGDAGDEAFGGYNRYAIAEAARLVGALPEPIPALLHALLRRLPGRALRAAREFGEHARLPSAGERYLFLLAHFTRRDRERVAGPALRAYVARNLVVHDLDRLLASSDAADPLDRLLDLDTGTYLPDDIFAKVDVASMAHSLEVRAPFADHVLLERMAALPGALKMTHLRGKQLLRRAVGDLLPPPVLARRKRGFDLPLAKWMRGELAEMSRDVLTDRTCRERGLIDAVEAARLLDAHHAGFDHAERLWNLVVLELWCREFLDGSVTDRGPALAPTASEAPAAP